MKRINIVRLAPVFALVASLLSVGCIGQTTSTEGTNESSIVSDRAHEVVNDDDGTASYDLGPARALELKTRPSDANQGPHPEPWLDQEGPHPEPWQSKNFTSPPPDPNDNGGNSKP